MNESRNIIFLGLLGSILFSLTTFAQPTLRTQFRTISIDEGLSQVTINDLVQDDDGFIWIATQDGLNRFDGYNFQIYSHHKEDSLSLPSNWLTSLEKDSNGNLWIGTRSGGLAFMEMNTTHIHRVTKTLNGDPSHRSINDIHIDEDHNRIWLATDQGIHIAAFSDLLELTVTPALSRELDELVQLSDYQITTIVPHENSIWVGTIAHGYHQLDAEGNLIQSYLSEGDQYYEQYSVKALLLDRRGNLWIGTDNHGLLRKRKDVPTFDRFPTNTASDAPSITNLTVETLLEDNQGNIWIGTQGGGLIQYLNDQESFRQFEHQPNAEGSLAHNTVYSLLEDRSGNIWVGTYLGGISLYNRNQKPFYNISHDMQGRRGLTNNVVRALHIQDEKYLWIGTRGGGLNRYNLETHQLEPTVDQRNPERGLPDPKVNTIIDAAGNDLWIGTWGGGLHLYRPGRGVQKSYFSNENNSFSLHDNRVRALYRDPWDRLWIASGELENGKLQILDDQGLHTVPLANQVTYNRADHPTVNHILMGENGDLWLATYNGLFRLTNPGDDPQNFSFIHFSSAENDLHSIAGDLITSVFQRTPQEVWVTVYGEGLNRLRLTDQPDSVDIAFYGKSDGLPDTGLFGIQEDSNGFLWLSSNHGLIRFDPQREHFQHFLKSDGLSGVQFNQGAYTQHPSSKFLFWGGTHGVTFFNPDEIQLSKTVPPVVLTDFRIFDRPVDLDTAITYKQKIQLSYDQNFFSFEFATLGFTKPGTSQYAYKLAGFDQDWIYSDTRRYASYTNLDPGQYTFWLKASNSDGIWGSSKQMITVEIIPPFWMTNLFKVGLMLVVVLLGFWVIRYREKTLRLSNLTLERKVQERTRELEKTAEKLRRKSEEAQKANLAKSHFLAGISHELRTPLNAILGFGQLLKRSSNLTSKQAEYVNTMHRSGEHLLSMINDVLDISKIEAGRMDIKKESIDLPQLVADISDMFRLQCNEKALSFSLTIDDDVPTYVFSDPGKIRQILVNLIGNAVKYTSTGSISVSVQIDPHISPTLSTNDDQNKVDPDTTFQQVKFTISDTGPGIPSDQLDSIFEPFKQVTDNFSDGTGLGLAITYRLITLLDGVIDVDSRLKQGSRFTVSIPMQVLGYAQSEETQSDEVVAIKNATEFEVLVVDDVEYNLTFLSALLGKIGMSCLEARDGSEAIQSYKKHQPDLILMDLRMPNVSGQEAMEAIRSIEADSNQHTPIIAVTASVFKESRGQLIESGFDEFISKPFSEKELFEIIEKTTPITFIRQAVTQQESVPSLSDQQTKPKQMAQAIQNLPSDLREQVIEAIELMDWERLAELNQSSVLSSTLSTYLDHIIQEQDYSKLLSLNEWVNPS